MATVGEITQQIATLRQLQKQQVTENLGLLTDIDYSMLHRAIQSLPSIQPVGLIDTPDASYKAIARTRQAIETMSLISRFLWLLHRMDNDDCSCLVELDLISQKYPIANIPWLKDEFSKYLTGRLHIIDKADNLIEMGLNDLSQTSLLDGLQICHDIQRFDDKLSSITEEIYSNIKVIAAQTLNVKLLDDNVKAKINVTSWANRLWKQFELFADKTFGCAQKAYLLQALLESKVAVQSPWKYSADVIMPFWKSVAHTLEKQLKAQVKESSLMLPVLQAGFPKLWRIFHDLLERVYPLSSTHDKSAIESTFYKLFSVYESAYASRSMNRLMDPVNAAFATKKVLLDDIDKIMRCVSSELDLCKFSPLLLKLASKNILKAINMYISKCDNLASKDGQTYVITLGNPTAQQLMNISIVNCCWQLGDHIWNSVGEYDNTIAGDTLYEAFMAITKFIIVLVESLLLNITASLSAALAKHFSEEEIKAPVTLRSEFIVRLKWCINEIIARFKCGLDQKNWYIIA